LEELGEKELGDILPGRLVKRIKERIKEEKEEEIRKEGENGGGRRGGEEERGVEGQEAGKQGQGVKQEKEKRVEEKEAKVNDDIEIVAPVLVIDQHRPDRIIFEGKEVKVTSIGFSLIYLLAEHRRQVMSYENILKKLWKEEEDAIYTRINYHICKIKKDLSKATNNKSKYVKKIQNIFKTVPGRGIMLSINEKELEINSNS